MAIIKLSKLSTGTSLSVDSDKQGLQDGMFINFTYAILPIIDGS